MGITYSAEAIPSIGHIIEVYESSGINRPTGNLARMEKMYANANLVVTAWHNDLLVGIARSLTDFCHSCYLADLAVRKEYQSKGVGKQLIALTREQIGHQTSLILLAAPAAINYYPKLGFHKIDNGYIIPREG
ncbi:MAG: GNAT family N-acetyltransferase [Bacteroidetes bacterium]|jgi:N-acetylglutamate synthase-like GNAT family acetyltransferase|nr:GNAT family N-acetyltransferase [Bacteroidota bacterium]